MINKRKYWWFVISGFLFGCSYLVNQTVFLLPWMLSLVILYRLGKAVISRLIVFLLAFTVLWGGWAVRNSLNVPPHGNTATKRLLANLTHGSYPGFIYKDPQFKYYPYREDPEQPEYKQSFSNFSRIFWKRFREKPVRYISWYFLEKPYYLWSWDILQGQGDVYIYQISQSLYTRSQSANLTKIIMKILHSFLHIIVIIGSIAVIFRLRTQTDGSLEKGSLLIFLILFYFTAIYVVAAPWPRYSIPLRPQFYLFAVWTISLLITHATKQNSSEKL